MQPDCQERGIAGSCHGISYQVMFLLLPPYSKSSLALTLTLNERKFNLSFSLVSIMIFLNSWRDSVVPYYVTTHPPAIQKQH
jgi:hypothetical protein